jgi:preprotein translocase subunit SecD
MLIRVLRFNIYLPLALAFALGAGCQSGNAKDPAKHGKNEEASLRIHLEVNPDGSDRSGPVSIGREHPFELNVEKTAFLTEFQIEKAAVVDSFGGYSISIQFNKQGIFLLEMHTTANKGRHLAIAAEFGEMRWLAAPLITQRLGDGRLVFTPDATRAEAERIVNGLNRVAERTTKDELK